MKNTLTIILSFLLSITIFNSCGSEKKAKIEDEPELIQEKAINVTTDMLTNHVDLVCGMDLNKYAIKDTSVYDGQLYGFCSEYCKQKFIENPQNYLANLKVNE